jgi:hypothetical protein
MDTNNVLLAKLLNFGDQLRYGMSEEEKLKRAAAPGVPGGPSQTELYAADENTREAARVENQRAVSAYGAGQRWGAAAPLIFNLLRETGQGLGTWAGGGDFLTPGGIAAVEPDEGRGFNLRSMGTAYDAAMAADAERSDRRRRNIDGLLASLKGVFGAQ